ncbi:phosphotransferase family protein [Streptomyces sp. WG7]|uniref:phosphotransferase family protein n=1 Tax=Streptomyces sp. WG7 TaxID=3417650 RepID=UPI003CF85E8F
MTRPAAPKTTTPPSPAGRERLGVLVPSGTDLVDELSALRLLVELGELDTRLVLSPHLTIEDRSRRSRCLIVRADGRGWVLKQGTTADTAGAVRHEIQVYRALARGTTRLPVPRLVHANPRRSLLVVAHLDGLPLWEAEHRLGGSDDTHPRLAGALGSVLARTHRWHDPALLPPQPAPPVLTVFRPGLDSVGYRSSASLALTGLLQEHPALCDALAALSRDWRPSALTHNDLRSDNLVVDPDDGTVHLIDWELGGRGDPYWDLAGPLAERLCWWLTDGELWVPGAEAVTTLTPVRRFTAAYLGTYRSHRREDIDPLVLVRWCAARLVQAAFETVQQSAFVTAAARQLLQLAANTFARPAAAAHCLLGLAPEGR